MATIYLIRHGQASFMQAHYDKLSELGVKQSITLGEHFRSNSVDLNFFVSGTLERQKDTFKNFINDPDAALHTDVAFNEHEGPSVFQKHFPHYIGTNPELEQAINEKGIHDPLIKKELIKVFYRMHLHWALGKIDSMGHESWEGFKERGETAYNMMVQKAGENGHIAIFTSGGMIALLVGKVLGISDEKVVELNWQIKNTSITELQLVSGRPILREFNSTPHLKSDEITFV